MEICKLTEEQYEAFFEFNRKINSKQKNIEEWFKFYFLLNPFVKDISNTNILIAFEENKIIGQALLNLFYYHYKGNLSKCFFGSNYYVLEEYRNTGVGAYLALKFTSNEFRPHFAIGVSKIAIKIHLSLNEKIIGDVHKFIWFRRYFSFVKVVFNSIHKSRRIFKSDNSKAIRFPEVLIGKNYKFNLIYFLKDWEFRCLHDNILEFSRSLEYIRWRFFNEYRKYHFYLLEDQKSSTYFVLRNTFWKGLNLLLLVDYRVSNKDINGFKYILDASKRVARMLKCDGIITASSLKYFDNILKKNLFIRIGRPGLIMTNASINFNNVNIKKRNFVYATMADSDYDLIFGEEI